jgi:hypothetical protein
MSVKTIFKEELLREIVGVEPDKLAPSLGSVVLAIGKGRVEDGEPYYKPSFFFTLTHPSENFINVLKNVVEVLGNKNAASIFLNLDMGSGKTHLLTLLLHLFASYNLSPQQISDYLSDYKSRTGYSEALARNTVVFAFDLRTPKLIVDYLELTERILHKLEDYEAMELVRKARESGRLPDAKKLAETINRNFNLLILIDELHYAAVFGDEEARKIVANFVKFVMGLLDYRRTLCGNTSGIAVVVASARRDFNRWIEIREALPPDFRGPIEGFIDQMQRIESTTHTRWLSLEETKRILEKRLGLKSGEFGRVFHKSFDKFIERVVRADTDVPQAHHLRSLIKAMAIYALEVCRTSYDIDIVTPAHFTEDVIEALLPGSELTNSYRSIYSAIADLLKNSNLRGETWAVNSIFSLTITGAPEKLVEMVRVAKTRTPPQNIPLVREVELREILKAHGLSDSEINEVIDALDTVHPNIHRVSLASGDYAYFVVPIASVLAIYRRMIQDEYNALMGNPAKLVGEICEELARLEYSDELLELKTVGSLRELEKKPHSYDKFYIYVYVNKDLLAQLSEEKQTKEESFNTMEKEARKFLGDRMSPNLVIVLPKITKNALDGVAKSLATESATSYVINEYIAPIEKPAGGQDEVARRLLEIELGDLKAEMGRRLNSALADFTSSISLLFAEAFYYTPMGVVSQSVSIKTKKRTIKDFEIQRVVDIFRNNLNGVVFDTAKFLAENLKQGAVILADSNIATESVWKAIDEDLKRNQNASFRVDEYRVEKLKLKEKEDRWVYIPPKIMKEIAQIVIKRVKDTYEKEYDVKLKQEGEKYIIMLIPKTPSTPEKPPAPPSERSPPPIRHPPPILPPSPPDPWENYKDLIHSAAEKGGIIQIKMEVRNRECADRIIRYLSSIREYIKEIKEEGATN